MAIQTSQDKHSGSLARIDGMEIVTNPASTVIPQMSKDNNISPKPSILLE